MSDRIDINDLTTLFENITIASNPVVQSHSLSSFPSFDFTIRRPNPFSIPILSILIPSGIPLILTFSNPISSIEISNQDNSIADPFTITIFVNTFPISILRPIYGMEDASSYGNNKILGGEKLFIKNHKEWFRSLEFWLLMNGLDWITEDLNTTDRTLNVKKANGKVKFTIY
jgi:hypothetical protein